MQESLSARQKAEQDQRQKREKEIRKNLAKVPEQKKQFWEEYHKLHEEIAVEEDRKEKVIQEVREFLGYDIDKNDPRFEEALLKKDEEEKNILRAQRKLEKQKQAMEMLQALVSDALEKEKVVKKKVDGPGEEKEKAEKKTEDKQ